ncbi:MAG: hypothetical protein QOF89_1754 [Acidobacteriota bacterium]|jgi:hypothetical protein|nr:hypothetical protein [Acidobacteriota bacterium]
MYRRRKSFCWGISLLYLCLILTLGLASPAGAAGKGKTKPPCRNPIHRLGVHRASRLHAPLPSAAKLKQAFADKTFQKTVQRVFDVAKLGSVAPELIAAVAALPDDAQPKDVPVGAKLDWMAYRRHGRPTVMYDACWLGKDAFKGWVFTLPGPDGGSVGLIVPVPCGNISRVELPVCVLKTDKNGDTTILDLTGSKAGGVPIATYGSTPDLPQTSPGVFRLEAPKCDPGADCPSIKGTLWVEDAIGLRSAPNDQCTYDVPGIPKPPVCQLKVTYDNGVFHVDASGSGVAVRTITITGTGPDGATVRGAMTGDQRTTDIPYAPRKSGDWTFTADVEGVNGLHSAPSCTATVRVCVPPTAKVALNPPYNCETRQLTIDVNGSSEHRMVTVTGPDGSPETMTGNGPTWVYDVKRSGKYTIDVTADDGICPENKAKDSTTVDVPPFGDSARWSLRVFGAYVRASEDTAHETLSGGTPFEERRELKLGGNHGGFGAGLEYRPLHVCDLSRWGVALDVIDAQIDSHIMIDNPRGWGMDKEQVSFRPVLFSLNYHFTQGRRADFFVGPSIGYAFLGNVTFHALGLSYPERFKDNFIYGLNFGVDVPFGAEHNYAFTAGLRQLFLKADASGPSFFSLDLNPTSATAGVAFRFR